MTATQLTITGIGRETAFQIADALRELIEPAADAVSVFEDGTKWRVDAYYGASAAAEASTKSLGELIPEARGHITLQPVAEENWVAMSQAALPPVEAGRFTICGSHDLERVGAGPNTIVVDAGEAFGTAHHATTYGCLVAISRLTRQRQYRSVLDLGCGSGILALALQRALPRARIVASDIDARSIEVARDNAALNGMPALGGGPAFIVSDGLGHNVIRRARPFDLIVANILAGPLHELAPSIADALGPGATLTLSGILTDQAPAIIARYGSLGLHLLARDRHHGWSTLTLAKAGSIRRPAGEPFNVYMPDYD